MGRFLRRWFGQSLSARILICLGLGLFVGLFVGEAAAVLQPVIDIYIRLMQMTVLPYLVTSLVIAFGQLNKGEAGRLLVRGGIILVLVWTLSCIVIVAMTLSFPDYVSAAFYSQALIQPSEAFSLTDIYFTANPFDSLSRNVVPAIVLFSSLLGIGLMGVKDKETLLAPLQVWNAAIVRITLMIVELTPLGVFAIGAVSAGTILPETLLRLEVYFIVFIAASLLLGFWILPLLVTAVTPFRFREVSGVARDALLTAFVASNAFIVLPILIERSKTLLERHQLLNGRTDSTTEVMIPVMFNFPNAGKLLTLLFVPFAAWLSGAPLAGSEFAQLVASGVPSYFAKAQVALPFLLDQFGLPQDLFELYIPTTIITGKFDSLVTAINLIVFALVGAGAMGGFLVFQQGRILRAVGLMIAGTAVMIVTVHLLLRDGVDTSYRMDTVLKEMHKSTLALHTVVHRSLPEFESADCSGCSAIERITRRGSLRIGYSADNLPMSFFNSAGELVGFDIELAEQLATALELTAEFVPITWPEVPRLLREGVIDVMPGIWYRPLWFKATLLSKPYFQGTVGLAMLDERRHEFARVESLHNSRGLTIGIPLNSKQIETSMARYFADAEVTFEVLEFWKPFFEGKYPDIDAFLMPAEHASGWTLLYPRYTVVVPQPDPVRIPSAFAMADGNAELQNLIDEWIVFADSAGIIQQNYDYWILGQGTGKITPRWSIMRNVLGWVD